MPRAEDRLRAQAEILPDPVDRVNDVVADLEVGERDRHAFFHGAKFHALRGLAVDLAVAEHVESQTRNREARFDVALVDEDDAALRHAGRAADERRRAVLAQVQHRRATFDRQVRRAQHLREARSAGRDERDRFAIGDPRLHLIEKHRELTIEMFDRARLEHERFEGTRKPRRRVAFDGVRHDERPSHPEGRSERRERRVRRRHLGEQRLADGVLVDAEFARLDGCEQHVLFARAFVFESTFDGCEKRWFFENHERVVAEIVEQRLAFVVREREPRFGNVRAARDVRARGRDRGRIADDPLERALAIRFVARNLAPGHDVERRERIRAPLRREIEAADRFDLVAEEFDARRVIRGRAPDVDDAAPHGELAGGRNHVGAPVSDLEEIFRKGFEAEFVADRDREARALEHGTRHHVLT